MPYRYLIGDGEEPVVPGSSLWESPLPMDRHHFQSPESTDPRPADFSHGDYFTAARQFLAEEGLAMMAAPSASVAVADIRHVDICLMKHGACYHPARIAVTGEGFRRCFVLNVAVSDPGLRIMASETKALKRLGEASGPSSVPRVHGQGSTSIRGREVRMFLGDWFEGYYEFHLSSRETSGLSVWGEGDIRYDLSREAAYLVYHQAAKLLTRYYNLETTEHISSWNHAAGDFVVKGRGGAVDVCLITVRRYGPLLRMTEAFSDPSLQGDQALAALLLFFLGISLRMRLDRLEGIGRVGWADDTALIAIWSGFLEGLSETCFPAVFLPDPVSQLKAHLGAYSPEDLYELGEGVAASIGLVPEEKAVVEQHLASHIAALCHTISRIGF